MQHIEKYPQCPLIKPRIDACCGALRYTFELTDFAVMLPLGAKYRSCFIYMFLFWIVFAFAVLIFSIFQGEQVKIIV